MYNLLSILVGCGMFLFYMLLSRFLQWHYYDKQRDQVKSWKIQSEKKYATAVVESSWDPFASTTKPGRHRLHHLFAGVRRRCQERAVAQLVQVNILIASVVAATVAELVQRSMSKMRFDAWPNVFVVLAELVAALAYQSVLEYYWHRLMHTSFCMKHFHRFHHFYHSPEITGYYCILFSVPFVIPMHFFAFMGYMTICGLAGVADHSGIRFQVPGIYNTEDHDHHHSGVTVNYGFPFPYIDILHGTFRGTFWGKEYRAS